MKTTLQDIRATKKRQSIGIFFRFCLRDCTVYMVIHLSCVVWFNALKIVYCLCESVKSMDETNLIAHNIINAQLNTICFKVQNLNVTSFSITVPSLYLMAINTKSQNFMTCLSAHYGFSQRYLKKWCRNDL